MKRIHLTKGEKTLIRQFSHSSLVLPEGMSQAAFVYITIRLQKLGLVSADVSAMKVWSAELTDFGKSYLSANSNLRNPIPWNFIIYTALIIVMIISTVTNITRIVQAM